MAGSSNHDQAARKLLAKNVRRLRKERGLTQEKLSLETGIMQSHISEIESGKRNATVDVIGTIACALGVKIALLFDESNLERRAPATQTRVG